MGTRYDSLWWGSDLPSDGHVRLQAQILRRTIPQLHPHTL
jgi:hypothetical protein